MHIKKEKCPFRFRKQPLPLPYTVTLLYEIFMTSQQERVSPFFPPLITDLGL